MTHRSTSESSPARPRIDGCCDWDDPADVERVVSELADDADELVWAAEELELSEEQAAAVALLALVACQDVEPGERSGQCRVAGPGAARPPGVHDQEGDDQPLPLRPAVPGGSTIDDFELDDEAGTLICPADVALRLTAKGRPDFGPTARCARLRRRCTTAKDGRLVVLHPHPPPPSSPPGPRTAASDGLDAVFRRWSQMVERTLASLTRGANRKVRYRGVARNRLCEMQLPDTPSCMQARSALLSGLPALLLNRRARGSRCVNRRAEGPLLGGRDTPPPTRASAGSPNGVRTRVSTLRGWCPRPLDDGANGRREPREARRLARGGGLEPPITGPEPVVLPITPPPTGRSRVAAAPRGTASWVLGDADVILLPVIRSGDGYGRGHA